MNLADILAEYYQERLQAYDITIQTDRPTEHARRLWIGIAGPNNEPTYLISIGHRPSDERFVLEFYQSDRDEPVYNLTTTIDAATPTAIEQFNQIIHDHLCTRPNYSPPASSTTSSPTATSPGEKSGSPSPAATTVTTK